MSAIATREAGDLYELLSLGNPTPDFLFYNGKGFAPEWSEDERDVEIQGKCIGKYLDCPTEFEALYTEANVGVRVASPIDTRVVLSKLFLVTRQSLNGYKFCLFLTKGMGDLMFHGVAYTELGVTRALAYLVHNRKLCRA